MAELALVGFDLDGTVIHPMTRRISARVDAALMAAHERGAACCIVSGRPYTMIEPEVAHAPWCDWVISSNGALVRSADLETVLQRLPILLPLARRVTELLADLEPAYYITFERVALMDGNVIPYLRGRDDLARDWDKSVLEQSLSSFEPCDSVPRLIAERGEDPLKVNFVFPRAGMVEEAIARLEVLGGLAIQRMIDNTELEITAAGVDKGDAFDLVREHLGVPAEQAVAFGDGGNDLPLAGHAFAFIAMGNATEELKAAADEVCAHVDDDGVALWLEERLGL